MNGSLKDTVLYGLLQQNSYRKRNMAIGAPLQISRFTGTIPGFLKDVFRNATNPAPGNYFTRTTESGYLISPMIRFTDEYEEIEK